jgi:hypothetical protein
MVLDAELDLQIEVTVKEGDSSSERGALLEALAKRILIALQYEHVSTEVRITGCELDVVAQDKQTGVRALVECKAYRDKTISADVLRKLVGTITFHDDYQSAWLISTAKLGKEAAGLVSKFREKNLDSRVQLRVYGPSELIDLLVTTRQIVSPSLLSLPRSAFAVSTRTLLVTDVGEFWAVSAIGPSSGLADTVLVFNAKDGTAVTNQALIQQLSARDSNLRSLQWIAGAEELVAVSELADASLRNELDNIAPVPVADDWSDYRPARPEDFVGRDDLLRDIVRFFDDVRVRGTPTRLLAIKAPSGWGKSSFLVKLKAVCAQGRNRERIFLYSVDCRTASSPRYPELALKRCLEEATGSGFLSLASSPFRIGSAGQPFDDDSVREALRTLEQQRKVIVLFFDQFEEITTKQELADLFRQIKMLCAAVESAGENIVLGFSWKTDGSIPTDHPAYHVWHSFADRRREFELPLFSKADISQLLGGLSRQLKTPIENGLRRLLAEHCQGYPWLLKKLCVHVFRVLQTKPAMQQELLARALDVEALFRKDLSDLDRGQTACLERIAHDSPADHFRIADQFGDVVVDSLLHRRLVVRNAGKLVLYWDIFRDFVLFKQVPAIPARYVPVSAPKTAKLVMEAIRVTNAIPSLSRKLGLEKGTLDNVARDLVMMGVCSYDRRNGRIKLVSASEKDTLAAGFRFFASHAFLRSAVDRFGKGFKGVPVSSLKSVWISAFAPGEYADKTLDAISRRMVLWFRSFGLLVLDGADTVAHRSEQRPPSDLALLAAEGRTKSGQRLFLGEAPPARVLEIIDRLRKPNYVPAASERNALYVLAGLRLIESAKLPKLLELPTKGREVIWLASKVATQSTTKLVLELIRSNPEVSGFEVGQEIARTLRDGISEGSMRRYGSGVLVWVHWLYEVLNDSSARLSGSADPRVQLES